jgi:hypothetical protein
VQSNLDKTFLQFFAEVFNENLPENENFRRCFRENEHFRLICEKEKNGFSLQPYNHSGGFNSFGEKNLTSLLKVGDTLCSRGLKLYTQSDSLGRKERIIQDEKVSLK